MAFDNDRALKSIEYGMRQSWLNIKKVYNTAIRKHNSTMSEIMILLAIDPKNGISASLLGPRIGVASTSLSRIVNILEEKGYIKRQFHTELSDRRIVNLTLTKEGLKKRDIAKEKMFYFNDQLRQNVDEEDLKGYYKVVETIINLTQNHKIIQHLES